MDLHLRKSTLIPVENGLQWSVTKQRDIELGTNLGAQEQGDHNLGICEYLGVHYFTFQEKFLS